MPDDPWAAYRVKPEATKPAASDPWAAYRVASSAPTGRRPTTDEEYARATKGNFPTPGETAATMGYGALKAIPGMAYDAAKASYMAPFAVPREAYAAVTGQPSPSMQQLRGMVQGVEDIAKPAYKAATGGVGTIAPEEMERAAELGGGAVAGLAVPLLPKGAKAVGSATAKVGVTPANVVKVLKFTGEKAANAAASPVGGMVLGGMTGDLAGAAMGAVGAPMLGRVLHALFSSPAVRSKIGSVATDTALGAAKSGNLEAAAQVAARALEKNPVAAEAAAEAVSKAVQSAPKSARPAMSAAERDALVRQIMDTPTKPKPGALAHTPTGSEIIEVVGPNGDRVVLAVKRGAKGGSDFDPNVESKASKHELQPEKISRRVQGDEWRAVLEKRGYDPDEVIGFAHFGPGKGKLSPGMVYVSPELRRQGLASAMYDAARKSSGLPLGKGALRPEGAAFRHAYDRRNPSGPVPGQVKMPTVYSNPKTPAGRPLTAAQRNAALEELQLKAAEEAGLDLADVFGIERPN